MLSVLREASENSSIKIVAVTGSGNYYSSGNDLSNFLEAEVWMDDFRENWMTEEDKQRIRKTSGE